MDRARREAVLVITDRATGKTRKIPARGFAWADSLVKISRAEGLGSDVDACASVARRLLAGEALVIAGFHYKIDKKG